MNPSDLINEMQSILVKMTEERRVLSRGYSNSDPGAMMDRRDARRALERLQKRYDELAALVGRN